MSIVRSRLVPLCLFFACIASVGCVEGDIQTFLRYDSKDDSFKCLQVYANLHATEKTEIEHLEWLYKRRASFLFGYRFLGGTVVDRLDKSRFTLTELGVRVRSVPEEFGTGAVDLDTIIVTPGEFYLNGHGNLGYYHQFAVPGKTADAILREVSPRLATLLADGAEQQLKLADDPTIKQRTWDEFRKILLVGLEIADAPNAETPVVLTRSPFDETSLRLLTKSGADKFLKVSREGAVFRIVVPLSARDCNEVIATVTLVRETVASRLKAGKMVYPWLGPLLDAARLRHIDGTGLELSVDAVQSVRAFGPEIDPQPRTNLKKAGYQTTITAIQDRKIPVNKTLTLKELAGTFTGK